MKTERPLDLLRSLSRQELLKRGRQLVLATAVALAGSGMFSSCSDYDLDERTPDGWGASIYSWLKEQGNYTNTVRLIDDLNYTQVLAKTGSKTLFVADDAAYERFYQNNSWGARSYKDLTMSQKKLLLFGSMMGNSMQLSSLPSVEGNPPIEGECLRRFADSSPYDSVAIVTPSKMPDNPYWSRYREAGTSIVCLTDNTQTTLVQLIQKLLENQRITDDDYNFLFNYSVNRQPGDASINGIQVAQPNIKCSNGFIHRMAEVVTPLPNMAELIKSKPAASTFNRLLERYCAPYPDLTPTVSNSQTQQYNYLYPERQTDTVYQKRFFARKSQGGNALTKSPDEKPVTMLKYDPEWNAYYAGSDGSNVGIQSDMAVMLVPSDAALKEYWEDGPGQILREQFGTWDNVPNDVIAELINNNMLSNFTLSVPSKFNSILNNANDPMGVDIAAIDSVWLGSNGAVYLTNKVYSPTTFVSVLYPALVNDNMKILYWAVQKCRYDVYLNSLNSRYSLFIPNNNAFLQYIDPCSYGKSNLQLLRFHWDPSKPESASSDGSDERVWASIYNYDPIEGIGDSIGVVRDFYRLKTALKDILDTHIVIDDVETGYDFYRTKGGTFIRVNDTKAGEQGMSVAGSRQIEEGRAVSISRVYDQTVDGNGKSYVMNDEPIMTTRNSVKDILNAHEEFSKFNELMETCGLYEKVHLKKNAAVDENVSVFNTYNYTIYVPTNESIEALQNEGKLPRIEDISGMTPNDSIAATNKIQNFVRYHIQDRALLIGSEGEEDDYETALIDPSTERFVRVHAALTPNGLTLRDAKRNVVYVKTDDPNLYNIMAREYLFNTADPTTATMIETSSSAVIHLIDKPLASSVFDE